MVIETVKHVKESERWKEMTGIFFFHFRNMCIGAIVFALCGIYTTSVFAKNWQLCDISQGHSQICHGMYNGTAIINTTGDLYQKCDIALGKKHFCHGPFHGEAVIYENNASLYKLCDLVAGRVTNCHGIFTGKAVIQAN